MLFLSLIKDRNKLFRRCVFSTADSAARQRGRRGWGVRVCACVQTLKVGSDCAAPCLSHMAMSGWYSMPPPTRSPLPPPRSKDNLNRDGGEEGVCQRQQRRKSASQSATRWSTDHPNFFLFLPSIFTATSSNETQTQSFDTDKKKNQKKKTPKTFQSQYFSSAPAHVTFIPLQQVSGCAIIFQMSPR